MTQHLADELKALAKGHPVPQEEKLKLRIGRLERMAKFYDDKRAVAPEHQSFLFSGFVSALMYAITMIKMYRRLTQRLAELIEEAEK